MGIRSFSKIIYDNYTTPERIVKKFKIHSTAGKLRENKKLAEIWHKNDIKKLLPDFIREESELFAVDFAG